MNPLILIVSFLAVLALLVFAFLGATKHDIRALKNPAYRGTPTLAFGDDGSDPACRALDPADVQNFGSKDVSRIQGNIAKAVARSAPWVDVLEGGTLAAGVSDQVRAIVQERAVLNQSLVRPTFTRDTEMCGKVGESAEVGTTEYSYELQTNRGMGPLVCVKGMRNAFESSYQVAEDALKKQVIQLTNSDVRITLVDRSGSKLVVRAGDTFDQMFDGDMQRIDQPFVGHVPTAPVNIRLLEFLGTHLRENLLVEPWENGPEPVMKFIGSTEIISRLRDDAGVKENHQYLAAGSYDIGKNALVRYRWEGPYRGWAFGHDNQPLRYSYLDSHGQPLYIEPEIRVQTSKGVGSRPNPAWIRARYEIAVAMGQGSFRRLAPAQYTGEGSFKFPAQLTMGELKFKVIEDNCNNVWGDWGRHYYQMSRAYRPERPHAVVAIAFKRVVADFGLTAVSDFADYSSTDSL